MWFVRIAVSRWARRRPQCDDRRADDFVELARIGCDRRGTGFDQAELLVGITNAVNHGDGAQHRNHPEHGAHSIEQRTKNDKHDALRALHESGFAALHKRLGASAGVADHHGTDHDERHHHHVEEAVGTGVVDQQSEEQGDIAVAVDDGIEEAAELRDLVSSASDAAVNHVEDSGADDDQACVDEHALLVFGVGVTEKKSRNDIDQQADEGEGVRRDLGQGEAVDNLVQQPLAGTPDCARPSH